MKVGIIGRTNTLLRTAERLTEAGHEIAFVWTSKAEAFYRTEEDAFENLAKQHGVPFIQSAKIQKGHFDPSKLQADLCVSINFVNITPKHFRDLFQHGVLNAHAGDLPRYRGNACSNWAILNDEPNVALTIHEMEEALDAGPIYYKSFFELSDDTYIGDIYSWLETEIPNAFCKGVEQIVQGKQPTPQDTSVRPLRTFPRKPEDSKIDWHANAIEVRRLIRASGHPFDGAYSTLNGDPQKIVRIFRAEPIEVDYDYCAMPGQLCFVESGDPVIACGSGLLRLTEIEANDPSEITASLRNRLV